MVLNRWRKDRHEPTHGVVLFGSIPRSVCRYHDGEIIIQFPDGSWRPFEERMRAPEPSV